MSLQMKGNFRTKNLMSNGSVRVPSSYGRPEQIEEKEQFFPALFSPPLVLVK